ncbi:hypothetical protein RDI58_010425 [Solanum bulbocastanum]|uniref:Uncharacterized protein n=1 Tax=Solanum bulbocastanum TaxID=147425 RepID=A0AAN8TQY3_SOLBU
MDGNKDTVTVQERTTDGNLHRHTIYAQMSPERKQLFLSHVIEKGLNQKEENSFINQIVLALLQLTLLRYLLKKVIQPVKASPSTKLSVTGILMIPLKARNVTRRLVKFLWLLSSFYQG